MEGELRLVKPKEVTAVVEYIKKNWENCIRENREDSGTLLGLPYPYTVPCPEGMFQEMYYWDTYFTNQGLAKQGLFPLVRNNTDNLLFLADKYGFVPNGSRTYYLDRSQPPYLSMMVDEVYKEGQDRSWLEKAYLVLKKEYEFWMTQRIAPNGLNRYFNHSTTEELFDFINYVATERLAIKVPQEQGELLVTACHFVAEAESGCDFNPRFHNRCADFNPVELNCQLYVYEKNFARFAQILQNGESALWEAKAAARVELINKYCWDERTGLFMDYDYANQTASEIQSLTTFYPLWAGFATKAQAESVRRNLKLFEYDFGLSACKKGERNLKYQWDYPNGWPPQFFIVIEGLRKYQFTEDARRIAKKYVELVVKNYQTTGKLWEKYNVVEGSVNVADEYKMPAMMGWTAGVFIYAVEIAGLLESAE